MAVEMGIGPRNFDQNSTIKQVSRYSNAHYKVNSIMNTKRVPVQYPKPTSKKYQTANPYP